MKRDVLRTSGYADTTYQNLNVSLAACDGVGAVCRSAAAGCVMAGLKDELPGVAVVVVVICLAVGVWAERRQVERLRTDNATLTQQRDEARRILNNQQRTMQFFNTLSKAATDEKQRNTQQSDTVRAEIRPALAAEPAARVVVPAVAADRVRAAVSEIRAGATGAAPR